MAQYYVCLLYTSRCVEETDAKTNELNQVRIVTNPAEEDYLGIQTKEVQTEATGENEAKTSVQVATVYSCLLYTSRCV